MEKETWIQQVLKSTEGLEEAQPNPFLYNKVMAAVEKAPAPGPEWKQAALKFGFAMVLIAGINLACLAFKAQQDKERADRRALAALSAEMGFTNQTGY